MDSDFIKGINKSIDAATGTTGNVYEYEHHTDTTKALDRLADVISSGGGGGGSSTLTGLTDVDISSPQNKQSLVYKSESGKWVNEKIDIPEPGPSWNDLIGTLPIGETEITFEDDSITVDSTIDYYTTVFGVNPTDVVITDGSVTLTFDTQEVDLGVKVRVS